MEALEEQARLDKAKELEKQKRRAKRRLEKEAAQKALEEEQARVKAKELEIKRAKHLEESEAVRKQMLEFYNKHHKANKEYYRPAPLEAGSIETKKTAKREQQLTEDDRERLRMLDDYE